MRYKGIVLLAFITLIFAGSAAAHLPAGQVTQDAARIDPFYLRQFQDGKDFYAQGRFEEAAGVLKIASFGLADAPDLLLECLVYLTVSHLGAGDAAAARRCYDEVARLKLEERLTSITLPAEVRDKYLEGAAMLERGGSRLRGGEAERPSPAPARPVLAGEAARRMSGRQEIAELRAALRKDRTNSGLRLRLFKAYERLDMKREANSALRDWLKAEPGSATARIALAAILLDEKKPREALRELRKVGAPLASDIEFHYLLGRALFETMDFAAAGDEFLKVKTLEPDYKDAVRLLEDCRSRLK